MELIGEDGMAKVVDNTTDAGADATAAQADVATIPDLNGRFNYKVDEKGRVSLPAKFRKVLPKELVVTRNPDDECLWVFEPNAFNEWIKQLFVDRFGKYDNSNKQHIRLRSKLKARSESVAVDGSGRIMLPASMRDVVGIVKDVALIGNTGYFEVWDAKRYDEMDEEVDLDLLFH